MADQTRHPGHEAFDPRSITRPEPVLWRYFLITAALTGPGFFFAILPLWFRYITLRYRFDDEGVSMSWGILFKREILLTYRRIQDVHVTRNIIERWFGLAKVSIQTASGTSGAEMTILGVLHAEALRDFLYLRMRGARGETDAATAHDAAAPAEEALSLLREIRDEARRLRARLEQARPEHGA